MYIYDCNSCAVPKMKIIITSQAVESEGSTLLTPEPQQGTNLSQVHPLQILIMYFALIHFSVSLHSIVAVIPTHHTTTAHIRI
jgi:hypothetical protein